MNYIITTKMYQDQAMFDLSCQKTGPMSLVHTRHGPYLILDADCDGPAGLLRYYGEFCEFEIELLGEFINDGSFVIEVGTNIGTHAIPLSRRLVPHGRYIAYEPQPVIAALLEANLALNGMRGVEVRLRAAGDHTGVCAIPSIDYSNLSNTGGVTLTNSQLDQSQGTVPIEKLDDIERSMPVTLIKIDAEHMELQVLRGASRIIDADRPVIYFEEHALNAPAKPPRTPPMAFLAEKGYILFGHRNSLHNDNNFNKKTQPFFGNVGAASNILAIPDEKINHFTEIISRHNLQAEIL